MQPKLALALLGFRVCAVAAPSKTIDERASTCTFTSAAQATASKKACSNIVLKGITVPAGTTLDMTGLNTGTTVTFQGTTSFGYKEWEGPLISFSGKKITVNAASGSLIDGGGARWWDGKGSNGGKTKPKFFYAHNLDSSSINGLNVKNTPVHGFSIQSDGLTLKDMTIDNSAGDAAGGHNTDAFDVGNSDGVYIIGAKVKNQDDCLAVNSGSNIQFTGGSCSGGHGVSIGSVGGRSNNEVSNVYIADTAISNSDNGVRVKTVYGATGSVRNVTYTGITLSNVAKYGVVVEQDYENGSPTGDPTSGVPITDLTVSGVTGSVAAGAARVYILCGPGACSGWTWKNVSFKGGKASSKCENVPSGASC